MTKHTIDTILVIDSINMVKSFDGSFSGGCVCMAPAGSKKDIAQDDGGMAKAFEA